MATDVKRVQIKKGSDLASVADAVRKDKAPRVLERDGAAVAALVTIEDLNRLLLEGPPREGIDRALAAAGAWADAEGDRLLEDVYRARHESPPSRPLDS